MTEFASSDSSLIESLQRLNVKESFTRTIVRNDARINPKRHLYVDLLNFSMRFFPQKFMWNVKKAFKNVQKFVNCAARSRITLKCFVDDISLTTETLMKWKNRRNREVSTASKEVPQGLTIILGDMFRKCGVEVLYSQERDNDDTLAFYAQHDGADILSGDKDMLRYVDSTFRVFGDYHLDSGRLNLIPREPPRQMSSPRALEPPPLVSTRVRHIGEDGVYRRGCVTALTRQLVMSPHRIVTPLRRAAFHLNLIHGPITEIWPEWSEADECVVWHEQTDIHPELLSDEQHKLAFAEEFGITYDHCVELLHDPVRAWSHFFPPMVVPAGMVRQLWSKHLFCLQSLVFEICVSLSDSQCSLLDLLQQHVLE